MLQPFQFGEDHGPKVAPKCPNIRGSGNRNLSQRGDLCILLRRCEAANCRQLPNGSLKVPNVPRLQAMFWRNTVGSEKGWETSIKTVLSKATMLTKWSFTSKSMLGKTCFKTVLLAALHDFHCRRISNTSSSLHWKRFTGSKFIRGTSNSSNDGGWTTCGFTSKWWYIGLWSFTTVDFGVPISLGHHPATEWPCAGHMNIMNHARILWKEPVKQSL